MWPVPEKSASPEQDGFMVGASGGVVRLKAEGYVILCGDGATTRRWHDGGCNRRRTGSKEAIRPNHSKKVCQDVRRPGR